MRILLIAELANPDWVSVPLEGYCLYEALSRVADVHLVTQVRNEENLRKAGVAADWFTALDNRSVEQPLYRAAAFLRGTKDPGGVGQTINTALSTFAYYWFEVMLWRRFGGRIRAREFDVVHRLTPLSPTIPSVIAPGCAKAGVPFVVGPLNGGLPWPRMFSRERHQEKEWLTYVRDGYKLMPGYRSTRRRAAAIIAGSRDTLRQVASAYREKCVYIPENGLDPKRFDLSGSAASSEPVAAPLRVAFVGRMVPYKLPGLVLDAALPLLQQNLAHVDFYGDGPELPKLKEKVAAEGLSGAVTFHGGVRHDQLREGLAKAHVFAFPSVREFGGAVVLEAMAQGLVPIVVDYGGPGEHVSPSTGYAIPMGPPEAIVEGLRSALQELLHHPEKIRPMGEKARERVRRHYTWDAKAAQVMEVYRWVLGQRGKPDFGMPLPD